MDECDRIMEQIKQNWLPILNEAIFGADGGKIKEILRRDLLNTECLNVHNLVYDKSRLFPYQKLLLSATLTRNPEKLEQMKLFQPIYFTIGAEKLNQEQSDVTSNGTQKAVTNSDSKEMKMLNDLVSKRNKIENGHSITEADLIGSEGDINVPKELSECFIELIQTEKPLVAIYLIKKLGYRRMLCFVKSKDTAKRLNKLFELNKIKSMEYSSSLHGARRKRAQTKFEEDKLDVLVCSDVMARGMDLANVDYVLLYDAPRDLNSYVHKVGRTARAGRSGTAFTFLEKKEVYFFKKMTKQIGSSGVVTTKADDGEESTNLTNVKNQSHKIKEIKVKKSELKILIDDYRKSLLDLKEALRHKNKTESTTNGKLKSSNMIDEETNGNIKKRKQSNINNSKYLKRIKK